MLCIHACIQQRSSIKIRKSACETYADTTRSNGSGTRLHALYVRLITLRTVRIISYDDDDVVVFFSLFLAFESGKLPAQSYPFKEAKISKYPAIFLRLPCSQLPAPRGSPFGFRCLLPPAPPKRSPCSRVISGLLIV